MGIFYASFRAQVVPANVNVPAFSILLAGIHAAQTLAWFAPLIAATRPLGNALTHKGTTRALDGLAGSVLIGLGLRLALSPHAR